MCALFGGERDVSLFRHINREMLGDIITQQVSFFKLKLEETTFNVYGEAPGEKYYVGPILFDCLVEKPEPQFENRDQRTEFAKNIRVRLLKDDFLAKSVEYNLGTRYGADLKAEVGDIIMYNEDYFELTNVILNQHFVGKDPNYPNATNPYSPGLEKYGTDLSIICDAVYVSPDKVGITRERLL